MAIKLHWGDNGSYKTAGCVMDDIIPAIKDGRTIVTNIRGLTYERCLDVFPDAPSTFKMINLNLDSKDGLDRCRNWFQWVDHGSLVVFDEVALVFLQSWRDSDLKQFDWVGGVDAAFEAGRPSTWLDAWTRHRHWGWDVVLTTPDIKYIRNDIRQTSQSAYKHTNYGVLGPLFKKLVGDYKEVFHAASSNQPSPKSITRNRRIDPLVWDLYDSTANGQVTKDFAGTSIFKSIPLLLGLLVCILAFSYSFLSGGYSGISNGIQTVNQDPIVSDQVYNSKDLVVSSNNVSSDISSKDASIVSFLRLHSISIASYASLVRDRSTADPLDGYSFLFETDDSSFEVTTIALKRMGVSVFFYSDCVSLLEFQSWSKMVGCYNPSDDDVNDEVESYAVR